VRHGGWEKGDQDTGMGYGRDMGRGEVDHMEKEKKRKRKREMGHLRNFGPKSDFGVLKTFYIFLI
jgi:hypothetical protein